MAAETTTEATTTEPTTEAVAETTEAPAPAAAAPKEEAAATEEKAAEPTEAPAESKVAEEEAAAETMMLDIINIVVESYKGCDKRILATTLYDNLVAADPAIAAVFGTKNQKLLATSFIGIMQIILDELTGLNVGKCDRRMKQLGARHVTYKIGVNMFSTYQACLMQSLEVTLGDKFDAQTKYAWAFVWSTFVTTPISLGWQEAAKIPRGKAIETVQASFDEVAGNQSFADILFERFFSYDEKMKGIFGNIDMAAHKKKLVGFIGKGLKLAQSDDPDGEFRKMGMYHKEKNVQVSHFIFFEEAILYALRGTLKEKFTGELADSWAIVVHNEFVEKMALAPFKDIEDLLIKADADGDGIVTKDEWIGAFKDYNFTPEQLAAAYQKCDADNNGTVEAIEFVRMLSRQQLRYPRLPIADHVKKFVEASQ